MISDARSIPGGTSVNALVCIVGGGVAGITLALELSKYSMEVVLLEGGGHLFAGFTSPLRRLHRRPGLRSAHDAHALPRWKLNCWGGWCQPFSSWISGIALGSLTAVGPLAQRPSPNTTGGLRNFFSWAGGPIIQIGHSVRSGRRKQFPFDPHVLSTLVRPLSPPTRFGTRYRDALWRSATVKTLLNANAVQLETNADGTEVVGARVKTTASHEFRVGAKIMILCAGGVENARLLLSRTMRRRPAWAIAMGMSGDTSWTTLGC